MKNITLLISILWSSNTLAMQQFHTTQENSPLGTNQTVTLEKETSFNLIGNAVKIGDYMPSISLVTSKLKSFDTSHSTKVRIYSVLTSVDTPVCIQQAVDLAGFIKENSAKLKNIEFYAISADTPFAQQRFIDKHKLNNLTFLSDSIEHKFGKQTGTQIKELGLLSRSIIVVDKNNKIVHLQRVPELTTLPDLSKASDIALKLN